MRIGLVSCAKTKQKGVHPAKELYCSALFRQAFSFAVATCDRVYILSAKHGLLMPETRIRDYNVTLNSASRHERQRWGKRVLQQLENRVAPGDELFFFCGKKYREYLTPALHGKCHLLMPLRGLSLGQQLHWYKMKTPPA